MIISTLEIKNILSIKEAVIPFNTSGLILLEGYNYDDNRGNGSGKTAIFNALSFALFDKVPRKISKTEILRRGTKSGFAYCEMKVGVDVWSVKRYRPSKVEFHKNGNKIDIQQDEFESKIGLTYNQFLITMYTAQGAYDKRFISLNDTSKKSFILEVMNLDRFSDYYKECSKRIKDIDAVLSNKDIRLQGLKSNISIYKDSLGDIPTLQSEIDRYKASTCGLDLEIDRLRCVEKPDTIKYDNVRAKIALKKNQINDLKIKKSQLTTEIITLERSRKHTINADPDHNCPNCNEPLFNINNSLIKLTDIDELNKQKDLHNEKVDESIKAAFAIKKELELKISKESVLDNMLLKLNEKQREDEYEFNNAKVKIHQYRNDIKMFNQNISSLTGEISSTKEKITKITEILKNAKALTNSINKKKNEKLKLEAVSVIFAPTGAPAHIMEEFVDNFNDMMQDNIATIWPNASYSLQTYKVNKDKSIKAKFSESLIIDSKEISIGSLSGGEFRSLSLAADFAIIDVLQKQFNINLCPIILDEPFDGLDSIGREIVISLLNKMSFNRQIWVIDHASEAKTLFSKIIKVEKRNGVSVVSDIS